MTAPVTVRADLDPGGRDGLRAQQERLEHRDLAGPVPLEDADLDLGGVAGLEEVGRSAEVPFWCGPTVTPEGRIREVARTAAGGSSGGLRSP